MTNLFSCERLLRLATGDGWQRRVTVLKLLPLVIFIGISFLWFYPVIQNFSTAVAGVGGDPYQTLWRFNRLGETVQHGSLFVSEEKSFPNLAPLPWLPVFYLFGDVVAYNTAWIVSAILAGYLGFLLARQWGAKFIPALFAGLLIEFAPYRIAQSLGHFGAMQIWTLLAVLICLMAWYRKNNLWYFGVGMIFSIWTAWTDHQLFVVLLGIIGVFAVFYWRELMYRFFIASRAKQSPQISNAEIAAPRQLQTIVDGSQRRSVVLILAYVVFFLIMIVLAILPFAGSISSVSMSGSHFDLGGIQRERYSASLRSLLLPAPFSVIGAKTYDANIAADNVQTLGFILPLATLILFLVTKKKKKDAVLIILILVGVIIALGTTLNIRGVDIPLPGRFLFHLPVLSAIRTIGRFAVLPVIFLPIYFAIKWDSRRKIYLMGIGLLCLLEILPVPGFPVLKIDHSKAKQIAENLGAGSVLAIPAYTNYQYGSEQLYYSLDYKKNLVGNSALSRIVDPKTLEEFLATPVIRDLVLLRLTDFDLPTIFGQSNNDILNLSLKSQGISDILLETKPVGGVVSFEGNKSKVLDDAKIALVQRYLRDTLGMRERKIGSSAYIYDLTNNDLNGAQYFVMEGKGWFIKKKTNDVSIVELQKQSEFYVYSIKPIILELSAQVINTNNASLISVRGEYNALDKIINVENNQEIFIRVEIPEKQLIKTIVRVLDGNSIMLQNLRVKDISWLIDEKL